MAENSLISWTDHTWNPWRGCTKVSPACKSCYAEALSIRYGLGEYKKGVPRIRTSEANWKKPYVWNKKPLICNKCQNAESDVNRSSNPICGNCGGEMHRARVFSLSLGDWLDDEVPIEWLADMLKVIHDTPNLDWLCLSKRPENFFPRIRLAIDFLLSTGYTRLHAESTERKGGLRSDNIQGIRGGRSGESMESNEADIRPVDERRKDDALQEGSSGVSQYSRVSPGQGHEGQQTDLRSSTPPSVASLQRGNTSRDDRQPQERKQSGQPHGESGIGNNERTANSRNTSSELWEDNTKGRTESEASSNRIDGSRDSQETRRRGEGDSIGGRLRNDKTSSMGNLPSEDLETHRLVAWLNLWVSGTPPSNVRIGITAENQKTYDERLIPFLSIPAYSRFISMEPLLENIDLNLEGVVAGKFQPVYMQVDQIIVGGESGPAHKERVLDLKAVANIYAQCRRWGVKYFCKQDSGPRPGMRGRIPDELWVQEFPD
jgi:protein gp37